MRKWTVASALLLLSLLFLFADQGMPLHNSLFFYTLRMLLFEFLYAPAFGFLGRKFQANAEGDSDELVDPPKVKDKISDVPHGLLTDSNVIKRCSLFYFPFSLVLLFLCV